MQESRKKRSKCSKIFNAVKEENNSLSFSIHLLLFPFTKRKYSQRVTMSGNPFKQQPKRMAYYWGFPLHKTANNLIFYIDASAMIQWHLNA